MAEKSYPIATSDEEFRRLDMQAALFHDDGEASLDRVGVAPGWHCLDLCCGIGGLTGALSRRVGATLPACADRRRSDDDACSPYAGDDAKEYSVAWPDRQRGARSIGCPPVGSPGKTGYADTIG